jgi:hypothetical protein
MPMTATMLDSDTVHMIVAHPETLISVEPLQGAVFKRNSRGTPACVSGARAYVFCAQLADGTTKAVRFPKDHSYQFSERYPAVQAHIERYRTKLLVATTLHAEGAAVGENTYPVITMDWVVGQNLDEHIVAATARSDCQREFELLAAAWRASAAELSANGFAHGDIHAGNILVRSAPDPKGVPDLALVDYDSVWLPEITIPPAEQGKPGYRHPLSGSSWGQTMDAFPNTLVYLSLRAITAEPNLCHTFGHEDGQLLFTYRDVASPAESEVFTRLRYSPAPDVSELTTIVTSWITGPAGLFSSLDEVLANMRYSVIDLREGGGIGFVPNIWPPPEAVEPPRAPQLPINPRMAEVTSQRHPAPNHWGGRAQPAPPRTASHEPTALNNWPSNAKDSDSSASRAPVSRAMSSSSWLIVWIGMAFAILILALVLAG